MNRVSLPAKAISVLWLMCVFCLSWNATAQNARFVQMDGMAQGNDLMTQGLVARLCGVEFRPGVVCFRISILNSSPQLANIPIPTVPEGFVWYEDQRPPQVARELETTLKSLIPQEGLKPGQGNAGFVIFPVQSTEPLGNGYLKIPGFHEIPVRWEQASRWNNPLENPQNSHQSKIGIPLASSLLREGVHGIFETLEITPGQISIDLRLDNRNATSIDPEKAEHWNAAFMLTSENELKTVSLGGNAFSGESNGWQSGQSRRITLSFEVSHPSALRRWWLRLPSTPPMQWRWNPENRWEVSVAFNPTQTRQAEQTASFANFLTLQTERIRSGNLEAILQDCRSDPQMQNRMKRFFHGMKSVPVKDVEFMIQPRRLRVGETSLSSQDYGLHESIPIVCRYRIEGLEDSNWFYSEGHADFEMQDGQLRWAGLSFAKCPPFWELGYTGVIQSPHFWIFYRPDTPSAQTIRSAVDEAEHAWTFLAQQKLPLQPRYAAFFVHYEMEFAMLTQHNPSHATGAASAWYRMDSLGQQVEVSNKAMFLNDRLLFSQSSARFPSQPRNSHHQRTQTLTHELVHLSLAHLTRPWMPPWLSEGVAVYYAQQIKPEWIHGLRTPGTLSTVDLSSLTKLASLAASVHDPTQIHTRYAFSGVAVNVLIERFGEEKFRHFYAAYSQIPLPQMVQILKKERPEASETDRGELSIALTQFLLRTHYGISLTDLDQMVQNRILRP